MGAQTKDEREQVTGELCALVEAEADIAARRAGGLPGDGKRAAQLVKRVIGAGPQFWSDFEPELYAITSRLLTEAVGQPTSKAKLAALKSLLEPYLELEREQVWSEDGKRNIGSVVMLPGSPALTELLRFILGQRVERLGWNVSTQQPGGFTAANSRTDRGGIGERDLLVKRGENRVLTIAEALTLRGADANHILRHLDKLLGYIPGGFRLGFLISWGYSRDIDTTWGTYRDIIADRGRSTHLKFPITRMGEVAELVMAEYLQGLRAFYADYQGGVGREKTRVIHVWT